MRKDTAIALALLLAMVTQAPGQIKVAVLPSWGHVGAFDELNNNWSSYGSTPLQIDTSLISDTTFTYADLVATGADVMWLSDPAGNGSVYSPDQIEAVRRYANEGHSILGTFLVFQWTADNRGLAPIFGLREDITYNASPNNVPASQSFATPPVHPLFRDLPQPYVSSGYPFAQVPADDERWDAVDLGSAEILAQTPDARGVITWHETPSYHGIYVSEMVEYESGAVDAQFLYNALTIPEPATLMLLGVGAVGLFRRRRADHRAAVLQRSGRADHDAVRLAGDRLQAGPAAAQPQRDPGRLDVRPHGRFGAEPAVDVPEQLRLRSDRGGVHDLGRARADHGLGVVLRLELRLPQPAGHL